MLGAILLSALDAVDVDLFLLSWLKGVVDDVEEEEGRSTSAEAILERRMFPKTQRGQGRCNCAPTAELQTSPHGKSNSPMFCKGQSRVNFSIHDGPGKDDGES
jgi:hypothetical protein